MPYKSKKQAAYLHIHEPKLAAEWDSKYGGAVKRRRLKRGNKIDSRNQS